MGHHGAARRLTAREYQPDLVLAGSNAFTPGYLPHTSQTVARRRERGALGYVSPKTGPEGETLDTPPAVEPRTTDCWVVLPGLNEAENLVVLIPEILSVIDREKLTAHVLVIDDGSVDGTVSALKPIVAQDPRVSVTRLNTNVGKASALRTGFKTALTNDASVIIMMDADGQDDPEEIPRFLAAIEAGSDLVTGARTVRRDRFIKRITSRIYNSATRIVSQVPLTDNNSGFKAMTAAAARTVVPMLYGEFHRYLTVIAYRKGLNVTELPVNHRPRLHGKTKYGPSRFWRGFVDLISVRFLLDYERRPSHFFAGVGIITSLVGAVILGWMLVERLMGHDIGERPLLVAGVLLFLAGQQFLFFGFLAELVVSGSQRTRAWTHDD